MPARIPMPTLPSPSLPIDEVAIGVLLDRVRTYTHLRTALDTGQRGAIDPILMFMVQIW